MSNCGDRSQFRFEDEIKDFQQNAAYMQTHPHNGLNKLQI